MGLFDITIKKELEKKEQKKEILTYIEKKIKNDPYLDSSRSESVLSFEKYKSPTSLLKYNLTIKTDKINNKDYFSIDGELQDVWLFVILILLSILLTQGIAIIPIIIFVFWQKKVVTKYLETFVDDYLQISKNKD